MFVSHSNKSLKKMEKEKVKNLNKELLELIDSFEIGLEYPELNFAGRLKKIMAICKLDEDLILNNGSLSLEGLKIIISIAKKKAEKEDSILVGENRLEKIMCSSFLRGLLSFRSINNTLPAEVKEEPKISNNLTNSWINCGI